MFHWHFSILDQININGVSKAEFSRNTVRTTKKHSPIESFTPKRFAFYPKYDVVPRSILTDPPEKNVSQTEEKQKAFKMKKKTTSDTSKSLHRIKNENCEESMNKWKGKLITSMNPKRIKPHVRWA